MPVIVIYIYMCIPFFKKIKKLNMYYLLSLVALLTIHLSLEFGICKGFKVKLTINVKKL